MNRDHMGVGEMLSDRCDFVPTFCLFIFYRSTNPKLNPNFLLILNSASEISHLADLIAQRITK